MPPVPPGVGTDLLRIIHAVDQQVELLSDLYLLDAWQVRGAIRYLHRTSTLNMEEIVADGGHHALHQLLWKVREGEVSLNEWIPDAA